MFRFVDAGVATEEEAKALSAQPGPENEAVAICRNSMTSNQNKLIDGSTYPNDRPGAKGSGPVCRVWVNP